METILSNSAIIINSNDRKSMSSSVLAELAGVVESDDDDDDELLDGSGSLSHTTSVVALGAGAGGETNNSIFSARTEMEKFQNFEVRFQLLVKYKNEHGSTKVPREFEAFDDHGAVIKLGKWLSNMRNRPIATEWCTKLKSLGVEFPSRGAAKTVTTFKGRKKAQLSLEHEGKHKKYLSYGGCRYVLTYVNYDEGTMRFRCSKSRHPSKTNKDGSQFWGDQKSVRAFYKSNGIEGKPVRCEAVFEVVLVGGDDKQDTPTLQLHGSHFCGVHEKLLANDDTVDEPPNETLVPDSSEKASMMMDDGQDGAHHSGERQFFLPDTRTPFMIMDQPQNSFLTSKNTMHLIKLLSRNTSLWEPLIGGNEVVNGKVMYTRWHAPELAENHPCIHLFVVEYMKDYIARVQDKYPALVHVRYGALKSASKAKSQYAGNMGTLHSDYLDEVQHRPPNERPVSVIVALDPFKFIYLPTREGKKSDLVELTIDSGKMIAFTSDCLHAGGENNLEKNVLQLFAYMVSNPDDFPKDQVRPTYWTSERSDATISFDLPEENLDIGRNEMQAV